MPREIQRGASIIRTGELDFTRDWTRGFVLHCGKESAWVVIKELNYYLLVFKNGFYYAAQTGSKLRFS